MINVQSHKSFRPITTLSFKLNWILFPPPETEPFPGSDRSVGTYSFHVANLLSHGFVSGLVTEAAGFVFHGGKMEDSIAQIVTGFLFGLHPVHAEAVSNITSRGEMLMSCFFLLAFLSYSSQICTRTGKPRRGVMSFLAIYVFPWIAMTLSLFSKEQGGSTLITLVVYDFLHNYFSVVDLVKSIMRREKAALSFVRRTFVLAIETLVICGWRYWLNGETKPDFIFDQNPAGFAPDRFTRAFSVTWVYCLYIWDAIYPRYLSVDWSGQSIPLITEIGDARALGVLALWGFAFLCLLSIIFGLPSSVSQSTRYYRTTTLISFVGFLFCPFLLSSNIFVVVGLMKADRVIYLPLAGFCMLEAQLVRYLCSPSTSMSASGNVKWKWFSLTKICNGLVLVQTLLLSRKVHERNISWQSPERLWTSAYKVNPKSHHTMYNCGYNLSLMGRYVEAEYVLRKISDPEADGPTTTFVYTMVLQNLGRCDEARLLIDKAMVVLEEQKRKGGVRNTVQSLKRAKSNLLVARGFCTKDIPERAKIFLESVEVDPSNNFAVDSATALNELIGKMKQQGSKVHL